MSTSLSKVFASSSRTPSSLGKRPNNKHAKMIKNSTSPLQQPAIFKPETPSHRRNMLLGTLILSTTITTSVKNPAHADDFQQTSSGLRFFDIKPGDGKTPSTGDVVEIHWSGYTEGYQGKRIDNTSLRDEPYSFVVGSESTIKAFQEAVSTMHVGGIRRIQIPGELEPSLGYSRDRKERFTNEIFKGEIYKYRKGPQPSELGGQRALDFVLDNLTLQDFNRTLLFDIKLLSVRSKK